MSKASDKVVSELSELAKSHIKVVLQTKSKGKTVVMAEQVEPMAKELNQLQSDLMAEFHEIQRKSYQQFECLVEKLRGCT